MTLRILFYQDPITDNNTFMWRAPHINIDAPLYRALTASGCDCRMLLDERFSAMASAQGIANQLPVRETEWLALLDDPQENINVLLHRYSDRDDGMPVPGPAARRAWAAELNAKLRQQVARTLGDFAPDVIMTWVPSPFLRALFPEALILYREGSMFTRAPFPLTYYFDPAGAHHRSWTARFDAASHDAAALAAIDDLRETYRRVFTACDPFPNLPVQLKPFRKTILVGTQVNNHFSFDALCPYRSQTHMLLDVLQHAPSDCAVLLGQHPGNPMPLHDNEINWLRERYPNFVHQQRFMRKEGVSQHLMLHADAIATGSSTVGWLGTLWGKPLIALAQSQLNRFAQTSDLTRIGSVLAAPAPDTRAQAAWLACHYGIPTHYFERPGWFFNYLKARHDHWRARGLDGYFDTPFADPRDLLAEFTAVAENSQTQLIGAPLAAGSYEEAVNFADERRFGEGWSHLEAHNGQNYRWIDGLEGELVLPLLPGKSYKLHMSFGTHPGCAKQGVSLEVDGKILAQEKVRPGNNQELKCALPAQLVRPPVTRLRLRAASAAAPPGETRQLSLICQHILVKG